MIDPSHRRLASSMYAITLMALVAAGLNTAAILVGPAGLGWYGGEPAIEGDAVLVDDVDGVDLGAALAERAATTVDPSADAIEVGPPVTVHYELDDPSTPSRIVWVAAHVIDPIVGFAGLWLVLGIVRSARTANPFTESNERRLWRLAGVVAVGGTLASLADDFARTFVLERSELADVFVIEATLSFLPFLAGLALAVLAGVWRVGVGMSDDLSGTI